MGRAISPQWQVIGADSRFDPYVLYDSDGNYACMRESKTRRDNSLASLGKFLSEAG
jgi:hypothetical protein